MGNHQLLSNFRSLHSWTLDRLAFLIYDERDVLLRLARRRFCTNMSVTCIILNIFFFLNIFLLTYSQDILGLNFTGERQSKSGNI